MGRKRSNKKLKVVKEETNKKKEKKSFLDKFTKPFNEQDIAYLEEFKKINDYYLKLRTQYTQYDMGITQMTTMKEKILSGEIGFPLMVGLAPNVLHTERNKDKFVKNLEMQIEKTKHMQKSIEGQVIQYHDLFAESGVRLREYLQRRLGNREAKMMTNIRKPAPNEKKLFEAEAEEFLKEEVKQEFAEAVVEATKRNSQKKVK